MTLISPNFDVVDHFFPILARGLFPKLLEKALSRPSGFRQEDFFTLSLYNILCKTNDPQRPMAII